MDWLVRSSEAARGLVLGLKQRDWSAPPDFVFPMLMMTVALVTVLTFDGYGFTIDEVPGYLRALQVYAFLSSGGANTETVSRFDITSFYGAMPDVIALTLQRLIPVLSYDSRHLVSALFGMAGIFYIHRFGTVFVGRWTGLFAAIFLAVNPMWFGYMFFNLKDIPFATMLLASTYYGLLALTGPSTSWAVWIKLAIAVGLLATTKVLGPLVLGFVGLTALVCLYIVPRRSALKIDAELARRIGIAALAGIVGCLVCFAAFWPQFYFYSATELATVINTFINFERWHHTVFINGTVYSYDQSPWFYSTVYLAIAMPFFLLALTVAGSVLAVLRREPIVIACVAVALASLLMQIITDARDYGGYRHFLFLVPLFTIAAAYAMQVAMEMQRPKFARGAAAAIVSLCLLWTAFDMYRLFPYQYSSYNILVGGIRAAEGRYDIDIWRSAEREALRVLAAQTNEAMPIRIFSCGSPMNAWADPRFEAVERPEYATYIIDLVRDCSWGHFDNLPVIAEVHRRGVLFARVLTPLPPQ